MKDYTEQICVRFPQHPSMALEVSRTPLVIDVPNSYNGIALSQEGLHLNKDFELGDVGVNTVWFIPPAQVLWVRRIYD